MKKSKLLLILIFSLVLLSCSKESFSVSSSMLYRNISLTEEGRRENAVLELSLSSSGSDETYSFLLISPDGDLRWEGSLTQSGSFYTSDTLGITDGARFEEGEYRLYIYSSSGSELDRTIPLQKEEGDYTFTNASSKDDAVITYYDREGFEINADGEADWALIRYSDRYSNRITLRTEFNV